MLASIAEILNGYLSDLSYKDRLAGIVRTAIVSENIDNVRKQKRFPVTCNVTSSDCARNGKFQDLVPNSSRLSVVYWEDNGGVRWIGYERNRIRLAANLRLIVWLNLKKLGKENCSFSDYALLEAIKLLPSKPFNSGQYMQLKITAINQPEKNANLFSKYTYDETVSQHLVYPYDYFAIDLTVEFLVNKNCMEPTEAEPELCIDYMNTDSSGGGGTPANFCDKVEQCVGNVQFIEVSGNGTATITITETIGKDILFVSTDGRIRKTTDYSHNATTGAFTFISAIQSTQKIYVLFK